jgi:hypothetical protein
MMTTTPEQKHEILENVKVLGMHEISADYVGEMMPQRNYK